MEKEDHLSNEISVSAELVDNSVKASAKSRALSGIDRLVGSSADFFSAKIEALTEKRREKTQGEVAIIRKAAEFGIQEMHADHDFAKRAFETHYKGILREQENKEAVVVNALEDLLSDPMSEDAMSAGPEELSEDFLGRFEEYAKGASTEELRERWGKILSGEIRKPGTFSRKVLRAIDELEPETALLFERVAQFALDGAMPICLTGELTFDDQAALISSGLILDPGMGHWRIYRKIMAGDADVWFCSLGEYAVAFPASTDGITTSDNEASALGKYGEDFALQIYSLSDVGKVLITILPDQTVSAFNKYMEALAKHVPVDSLMRYRLDREAERWVKV